MYIRTTINSQLLNNSVAAHHHPSATQQLGSRTPIQSNFINMHHYSKISTESLYHHQDTPPQNPDLNCRGHLKADRPCVICSVAIFLWATLVTVSFVVWFVQYHPEGDHIWELILCALILLMLLIGPMLLVQKFCLEAQSRHNDMSTVDIV